MSWLNKLANWVAEDKTPDYRNWENTEILHNTQTGSFTVVNYPGDGTVQYLGQFNQAIELDSWASENDVEFDITEFFNPNEYC